MPFVDANAQSAEVFDLDLKASVFTQAGCEIKNFVVSSETWAGKVLPELTWSGSCKNGLIDGPGILVWERSTSYVVQKGSASEGLRNGFWLSFSGPSSAQVVRCIVRSYYNGASIRYCGLILTPNTPNSMTAESLRSNARRYLSEATPVLRRAGLDPSGSGITSSSIQDEVVTDVLNWFNDRTSWNVGKLKVSQPQQSTIAATNSCIVRFDDVVKDVNWFGACENGLAVGLGKVTYTECDDKNDCARSTTVGVFKSGRYVGMAVTYTGGADQDGMIMVEFRDSAGREIEFRDSAGNEIRSWVGADKKYGTKLPEVGKRSLYIAGSARISRQSKDSRLGRGLSLDEVYGLWEAWHSDQRNGPPSDVEGALVSRSPTADWFRSQDSALAEQERQAAEDRAERDAVRRRHAADMARLAQQQQAIDRIFPSPVPSRPTTTGGGQGVVLNCDTSGRGFQACPSGAAPGTSPARDEIRSPSSAQLVPTTGSAIARGPTRTEFLHPETKQQCVTSIGKELSDSRTFEYYNFQNICPSGFTVRISPSGAAPRGRYIGPGSIGSPAKTQINCDIRANCSTGQWDYYADK